jgi:glycosyltransferase involved in cell wall biosynthesis
MKTVFISWGKYHARTELLARALDARVYYHDRLGRVRGPRLLLKYALQSLDTWRLLRRERPQGVLVQTPPVFPALLAVLYAATARGTRVILDAHSGSFFSRKWTWSLPLMRWCARRAGLTVVHMPSLQARVAAWGAPVIYLAYCFDPEPPAYEPYPMPPGTNIAVPCSFNEDEPLPLIFEAAGRLPEVTFHLTGEARRLPAKVLAHKPANVRFTGYLPVPAYQGLLRQADAVLALTTQDKTFQTGGAEAAWLGRPLIISDWPELQKLFTHGTVFVPHTPEGLAAGVREVQARGAALQHEMGQLKQKFDHELLVKVRRLRAVLGTGRSPAQPQVGDWAADKER